jgi:hypothetical protein
MPLMEEESNSPVLHSIIVQLPKGTDEARQIDYCYTLGELIFNVLRL